MGGFWVFFLSYTAPGFQLCFYSHLWIWVVHWGLLLRLPWRTWFCPCEGQVWRCCSCLGRRGSGSTRYSGGCRLGQQETQCSRRVWHQYWPICSSILAWRTPSLTEKPGRPQSTGSQRVGHNRSDPACIDTRFLCVCDSSAPVRVEREDGAVAWLVDTLAAQSVQG